MSAAMCSMAAIPVAVAATPVRSRAGLASSSGFCLRARYSLTGRTLAVRSSRPSLAFRNQAVFSSASAAAAPEPEKSPVPVVKKAPEPVAVAAEPFKWGAKMKPLLMCVALGTVLWFIPAPAGVTTKAWHLLAIFISTIAGIITGPLPLGAVAMLGLGAAMLTKTMTFAAAFSAFASEIP